MYRGSKGIFHRKQQNPRPTIKTNWIDVFTATHCGGSMEERERSLHRFRSLNTNKESKIEANGMIAVYQLYIICMHIWGWWTFYIDG